MSAQEAPLRRPRRRAGCALLVALSLVVLLAGAMAAAVVAFERWHADRIYPRVFIGNVDAGGLAVDEAARRVERLYASDQLAVFEAPGGRWFARWPEVGITVDAGDAARRAFEIGRYGALDERVRDWLDRRPVPVSFAYDPVPARAFLEQRRAEVAVAPRDARIEIDAANGLAVAVPAEVGRELDVPATEQAVYAAALSGRPVQARMRDVPAALADVSQPVAQLNDWLNRPFAFHLWWRGGLVARAVSPRERAGWVRAFQRGGQWAAAWDEDGVRAFLRGLNDELDATADLRVDEAATLTRSAFERGDASLWLAVPHREHRHVLTEEDTWEGLGDRYGIPVARLVSANPDIWSAGFVPGQAITIPSQNLMLPLPISPTNLQRIEVDLTVQRLSAYDGPRLVLSATIASGIPKWRTLTGVFQVLEHVDEAYNKLARIKMPNWLSIYDIGEPGESLTNGIHALPVLGGGRRLWEGYLGTPVSFGCVVMGIEDSDALYRWAALGTPVVIHGKTPPSPFTYDDLIEAQKKTEGQPADAAPAPEPTAAP
jgi:hypothetical protein